MTRRTSKPCLRPSACSRPRTTRVDRAPRDHRSLCRQLPHDHASGDHLRRHRHRQRLGVPRDRGPGLARHSGHAGQRGGRAGIIGDLRRLAEPRHDELRDDRLLHGRRIGSQLQRRHRHLVYGCTDARTSTCTFTQTFTPPASATIIVNVGGDRSSDPNVVEPARGRHPAPLLRRHRSGRPLHPAVGDLRVRSATVSARSRSPTCRFRWERAVPARRPAETPRVSSGSCRRASLPDGGRTPPW